MLDRNCKIMTKEELARTFENSKCTHLVLECINVLNSQNFIVKTNEDLVDKKRFQEITSG